MDNPIQNMTDKWLASMEARKRDRSRSRSAMAPWDENAYFQVVKEVQFSDAGGTVQQVVLSNPMRVGLIFHRIGFDYVCLSTKPAPTQTSGIKLVVNSPPFIVLQSHLGNLCQSEWYANFANATTLTVIEITLREFPS